MAVSKKTSGQSLIEFALILPLLLLLVMALFDIGRAVLFYAVLNTAAREGTRFAIVQVDDYKRADDSYENTTTCVTAESPGNINICTEVEEKLFNIGVLSDSTITIRHFDDGKTDPIEYFVSVDISYDFKPVTPGLNLITNFTLNVNSQMLKTPIATR